MTVCRTLLAGLMLLAYFQIYIFKMEVPESYVCDRAPCQQLTACYIGNQIQSINMAHIIYI